MAEIVGSKVSRPSKSQLAADIARRLELEPPRVSQGSSVDSHFLDAIHEVITGRPNLGRDTYRKTERVMHVLGLSYDPYWDTSEAAEAGGGTVTARAYSRIRAALTREPRCFILNTTDAPVGAKYEDDPTTAYGYDDRVTGRKPLTDAGPGTRVIFYSTSKSTHNPQSFIAYAVVDYISPGWHPGPWVARLAQYELLPVPVLQEAVEIPAWNHQHAITEITPATFAAIVERGKGRLGDIDAVQSTDPGGAEVAERVCRAFRPQDRPETAISLTIPADLPQGHIEGAAAVEPEYADASDGSVAGGEAFTRRSARDRRRDRLAEQRAVELTIKALKDAGWALAGDRQQDGVGYDLELSRGERCLHVEVKGIQGNDLVFNLTPKERWRAQTDPDFVVVAVTNVLSPTAFTLSVLRRDEVLEAPHVITGYRLRIR